jgi:hypothetical protein
MDTRWLMRRLSYYDFQQEQDAFEEAVHDTEHLAKFCSTVPWQCAAYEHLHGFDFGVQKPGEPFIFEQDGNWLVLAERSNNVYFPFEAAWMFGCPLVGEPVAAIDLLERACREHLGSGFGFVISGVLENSDCHRDLVRLGERSRRFEEFDTTDCLAIDLSGGPEAFLERRSRSFRKGIRQMKKVDSLEFQDASPEAPDDVLPRIFAIQSRSYKPEEGGDIFSDYRYQGFYRDLYDRLYQRGSIRTIFAQIEGKDVAYIMGGISRNIYRGFQMSYDNEFRKLALGNRLQLENIRRMSDEGITHYDLGMHSLYKERWADSWESYKGVFVVL